MQRREDSQQSPGAVCAEGLGERMIQKSTLVHRAGFEGGHMRRAYADVPDGQMHYRYEGRGEALLLLHMAGSASDQFERVIPFLSKN